MSRGRRPPGEDVGGGGRPLAGVDPLEPGRPAQEAAAGRQRQGDDDRRPAGRLPGQQAGRQLVDTVPVLGERPANVLVPHHQRFPVSDAHVHHQSLQMTAAVAPLLAGDQAPVLEAALSDLGRQLVFPPDIPEQARQAAGKELNATTLLRLPIETFTVKQRSGPPSDAASDLDRPVWAGVVPLSLEAGSPETAPDMRFDIPPPGYLY